MCLGTGVVWKKVAIGDTDSDESKVTDFFLRQGVQKIR